MMTKCYGTMQRQRHGSGVLQDVGNLGLQQLRHIPNSLRYATELRHKEERLKVDRRTQKDGLQRMTKGWD